MISLSARRSALVYAFALFLLPRMGSAQPPKVSSTVKNPAPLPDWAVPPTPDPPQISPEELQKLTGGPTLVTFSATDSSLIKVGKALFEAAGLHENPDYRLGIGKLSVSWNQTPFWTAAADVEKQTGGVWRSGFGETLDLHQFWNNEEGGLNGKLVARNPYILLIAQSIARTQTTTNLFRQNLPPVAPNAPAPSDSVRMTFSAYLDPALHVQSASLHSLVLQKQGEVAPPVDENTSIGPFVGGPIVQIVLPIDKAFSTGTVFSSISGVLRTVLVSATDALKIDDLVATPKAAKFMGNVQYALQSATLTDDRLTIRLTTTGQAAVNQMGMSFNDVWATMHVRDATGNELRTGNSYRRGGNQTQGDFSYTLKNNRGEIAPGPYSLEWKVVTETRSFDVPFELRDVVVP